MNKHQLEAHRAHHEELIELVGVHLEQGETSVQDLQKHDITIPRLNMLVESNHIAIEDDKVRFLSKGEREFLSLIRRHRLAERLMHDVLDYKDEDGSEEIVCKMEHIINEEVADSICTLLGHPTTCPHGRPIPPGRCCDLKQYKIVPLISPLNRLSPGEDGVVAFISTSDHAKTDRLAAMGIIPGLKIKLHQLKPAVVIMFDETVLSMDEDYAEIIFIRRNKS